ncbi:MAG: leucine-rich repeat protein [Acutalibacteraceae bacterium]
MMRTCKNCGKEFDDVFDVCPSCGAYGEELEENNDRIADCSETKTVPSAAKNSSKKGLRSVFSGVKKKVSHKWAHRKPLSKMQKLILILVAAVVVAAAIIIPTSIYLHKNVLRAHGSFGNGFSWEFDRDNGTLTIRGEGDLPESPWQFYGGWKNDDVVQHVVLEDGIISISAWFFDNWDFKTISLPDSITEIKDSAFIHCYQLESVIIPDGVEIIGESAFYGCDSLTEVTIPSSVEIIAYNAFCDCSHLSELSIAKGVKEIGNYAFQFCYSLTEVTIPSSVKTIGYYAFQGCSSLKNVFFFESVSEEFLSIEEYAFSETAIRKIYIPLRVTNIGNACFYACYDLETVEFDSGCQIEEIGDYAFKDCTSLTGVNFEEYYYHSLKTFGQYAFWGCSSLEELTVPEGVEEIGDYAFGICSSLKTLTMPESVSYLGENILYSTECKVSTENAYVLYCLGYDTDLTADENDPCGENLSWTYDSDSQTLTISGEGKMDAWEQDGDSYSFSTAPWAQYSEVETVVIEDGVTNIGAYAFYKCTYLTTVTIPNSVTSIDDSAFCGCEELADVSFPDKLTDIGEYAFRGCKKITSANLPNTVKSIGECSFEDCESLTNVVLPNGLKEIPYGAFSDCSSLKSVTVPNGVTSIGYNAFMDCEKLASVSVSDSVLHIYGGDYGAFGGTAWFDKQPDGMVYLGKIAYAYKGEMPKNTSISIKAGTKAIAGGAFEECIGLSKITIPSSVQVIGDGAFGGCTGLESITIPNSVNSVGESAFWGWSPLQTIYASTSSGWDSNWSEGCTAEIKKVESPSTTSDAQNDRWHGLFH